MSHRPGTTVDFLSSQRAEASAMSPSLLSVFSSLLRYGNKRDIQIKPGCYFLTNSSFTFISACNCFCWYADHPRTAHLCNVYTSIAAAEFQQHTVSFYVFAHKRLLNRITKLLAILIKWSLDWHTCALHIINRT